MNQPVLCYQNATSLRTIFVWTNYQFLRAFRKQPSAAICSRDSFSTHLHYHRHRRSSSLALVVINDRRHLRSSSTIVVINDRRHQRSSSSTLMEHSSSAYVLSSKQRIFQRMTYLDKSSILRTEECYNVDT